MAADGVVNSEAVERRVTRKDKYLSTVPRNAVLGIADGRQCFRT